MNLKSMPYFIVHNIVKYLSIIDMLYIDDNILTSCINNSCSIGNFRTLLCMVSKSRNFILRKKKHNILSKNCCTNDEEDKSIRTSPFLNLNASTYDTIKHIRNNYTIQFSTDNLDFNLYEYHYMLYDNLELCPNLNMGNTIFLSMH
jgi:hypothetical protein